MSQYVRGTKKCLLSILGSAILSVLFFVPPAFAEPNDDEIGVDLAVVVEGAPNNRGNVRIAIFSEAEAGLFPEDVPLFKQIAAANDQPITFKFNNLAAGRYAALVFHDENSNEILDRNFFGIPKECWGVTGKRPYGSNPRYVESVFVLDREHNKITIFLAK